jgi:hypothetical protein
MEQLQIRVECGPSRYLLCQQSHCQHLLHDETSQENAIFRRTKSVFLRTDTAQGNYTILKDDHAPSFSLQNQSQLQIVFSPLIKFYAS